MDSKLTGLIGMCRRAGKLSAGFDAVCADIAAGRAVLVLLATDASEKTCKEIRFAIAKHACRLPYLCRTDADKQALAHLIGFAKPVGVCCITDKGFAAAMLKSGLQPENRENEEDIRI